MTTADFSHKRPVMKLVGLLALIAAGSLFRASAAEAAPEKIGLAVGKQASPFTLKDQNERDVSLDALLKKGPVALVFYRSADW